MTEERAPHRRTAVSVNDTEPFCGPPSLMYFSATADAQYVGFGCPPRRAPALQPKVGQLERAPHRTAARSGVPARRNARLTPGAWLGTRSPVFIMSNTACRLNGRKRLASAQVPGLQLPRAVPSTRAAGSMHHGPAWHPVGRALFQRFKRIPTGHETRGRAAGGGFSDFLSSRLGFLLKGNISSCEQHRRDLGTKCGQELPG